MYCLPDPKDGGKRNLVPVLLCMDHLSGKDAPEPALTIDFHTGLAIESMNPNLMFINFFPTKKGSLRAEHCGLLGSRLQM